MSRRGGRLELATLCTRLLIETWNDAARDNQVRILQLASGRQIAEAIERIAERTHRRLQLAQAPFFVAAVHDDRTRETYRIEQRFGCSLAFTFRNLGVGGARF